MIIIGPDSREIPFNTEELQTQIIKACIAANETDSWIAQDLAFSVEFALSNSDQKTIQQSELIDMVVRALEDSGYPAVAVEFKRLSGTLNAAFVTVSDAVIREILLQNIALNAEQMPRMIEKIRKSLSVLGLSQVYPRLILELGRQFRDCGTLPGKALPRPRARRVRSGDRILISPAELKASASPVLRDLFENDIFRVRNVSSLFPTIRMHFMITAFADHVKLTRPVTELAFWTAANSPADAMDELCRLVEERGKKCGIEDEIPLYMTVPDATSFAVSHMNCPKDSAKECVRGLLGSITGGLKHPIFRLTLI